MDRPIARDLLIHKGASAVIAGEYQPPVVHALAHAMNSRLGNVGKTVFYTDPIEANPVDQLASLQDLMKDLDAGVVELLFIVGGNPVFNAPVDLGMRDRIQKARMRVHLSLYDDETSELCQWRLPEAHYLEAWGDARAFDGTATMQQPLIQPLYNGHSALELLQMFSGQPEMNGRDILRAYWAKQHTGARFRGMVAALGARWSDSRFGAAGQDARAAAGEHPRPGDGAAPGGKLEAIFRPDPTVYDGRFANNGWLQELPKPISKVTWDNAAILSVATAHHLGVSTGGMLQLTYQGRSLRAPVWVQPGHVDGAVTLHLGYGRTRAGRAGTGMGFNPYGLRTMRALWHDNGMEAKKLAGEYQFATTTNQGILEARDSIPAATSFIAAISRNTGKIRNPCTRGPKPRRAR